jgi:hypothetical protein
MHHSGYFRGALSGNFRETSDGFITLEDVDTDAFDIFVDWLYGQLFMLGPYPENGTGVAIRCRAYALADRLLAPGLKRRIVERLHGAFQATKVYPAFKDVIYLFDNLAEKDPMLQLVVDAFCINDGIEEMELHSITKAPKLPQSFLVRVLLKVNEMRKTNQDRVELRLKDYTVDA